jgi:serine/threonine-protein kinase RsbW
VKKLTITADLSEIDNIRQFLKDSLRGLPISEENYFKIELAIVEICVNVIRYGYPKRRGEIDIAIRDAGERIAIEIRDSGVRFDPGSVPKPDIDEVIAAGGKGSLGIYLVRQIMDEFDYRWENGENILTLVKTI